MTDMGRDIEGGEAGAEPPVEGTPSAGESPSSDSSDSSDSLEFRLPEAALSARERSVLALERRGWSGPGAKERAIRERLGLAPVRYYQLLNALLDDPRAVEYDPVTVYRLRRVREARREQR